MSALKFQGLTQAEAARSRAQHGENVLTPPPGESVWKLFFSKFNDPIIKVLMAAALLSFGVGLFEGHYEETIGILCAILLATGVAFWFEYDAKRRFDVLNQVNDDVPVKVIRDGAVLEIPRREAVVGDIVVLESGEEVPADGQLLEAVSLRMNESTLTGEPIISKYTEPSKFNPEATYPTDRVLRGTTVVEGHGIMRVDAVGDATEFGHVAEQSTAKSEEKTPLSLQLERLSKYISIVGSTLAVLIFAVLVVKGIFFGGTLLEGGWLAAAARLLSYFMVSVAIMVMAIPEGLPMSITLSLALSMRKMLKTNNLVRKMHACETMGAVTVICTDKTGTLTRNRMSVAELLPFGEEDPAVFAEAVAANSTAFLDPEGKVIGNPTEGALLLWLRDEGYDYQALRAGVRVIDQITFSTERKYMATLVESAAGGRMLYVKGAPEIVRAMCVADGLDDQVAARLRGFQDRAMRTLGFAAARVEGNDAREALAKAPLRFTAVAAIADPVRDDVPQAVRQCLDAGVAVKIVTGDTPATAREIGRQIGLWNDDTDGDLNQITGAEFAALTDEDLMERVQHLKIMSRARPLDKQRLVQLLQRRGEVVAVTGDGTNDAPALNFAHVGLSMGTGTSVAKEASDITLLDDSFRSIATAVMWGRSLYRNIQRFVLFQLTINFAAIVVVFFGSIFGSEIPLTVTQILWVNLIMDTFAAMALASLPPDPQVMKEKPRRSTDFIITRQMLRSIVVTGSVFVAVLLGLLIHWGPDPGIYRMSAFFTVFVLLQFWNLFNAKALGCKHSAFADMHHSKAFLSVLVLILAGQVLIVSFGDGVFRTVPLTLYDWLVICASTSLILWGGELIRRIGRLRKKRA